MRSEPATDFVGTNFNGLTWSGPSDDLCRRVSTCTRLALAEDAVYWLVEQDGESTLMAAAL